MSEYTGIAEATRDVRTKVNESDINRLTGIIVASRRIRPVDTGREAWISTEALRIPTTVPTTILLAVLVAE